MQAKYYHISLKSAGSRQVNEVVCSGITRHPSLFWPRCINTSQPSSSFWIFYFKLQALGIFFFFMELDQQALFFTSSTFYLICQGCRMMWNKRTPALEKEAIWNTRLWQDQYRICMSPRKSVTMASCQGICSQWSTG